MQSSLPNLTGDAKSECLINLSFDFCQLCFPFRQSRGPSVSVCWWFCYHQIVTQGTGFAERQTRKCQRKLRFSVGSIQPAIVLERSLLFSGARFTATARPVAKHSAGRAGRVESCRIKMKEMCLFCQQRSITNKHVTERFWGSSERTVRRDSR